MSTSPATPDRPSSSAAAPAEPLITSSWPMGAAARSYPPTEVQRWLICPVFRDYSARWESRVEVWTPHKRVGAAIHAGIAAYLRPLIGLSTCPALPASDALNGAVGIAVESLRAGYVQQETWGLAGLEALVTKGTKALIASVTEHLLPGAQVVAVECVVKRNTDVPEGVPGKDHIVDCVLQRGDTLEIWDWKVSLRLDDQYLPDRLLEAHHSWQLLDYGYHGQIHFKCPVSRVGQGLVILGPKVKVEYSPVTVTPERLSQWRDDATVVWQQMSWDDAGEEKWHNWQACTDKHLHYGTRCRFFEACHTFYGNEALFPALYRLIAEGDDGLLNPD